jgi:hypothetical protein
MNIKFKKYITTAFIMAPMTMIMGFVGVMRNYGLQDGWILKFFKTWMTMFPIAYVCALFVIPIANKIVGQIKFQE